MGFEPTEGCPSNDFESFAFDHSATSPNRAEPCRRRLGPRGCGACSLAGSAQSSSAPHPTRPSTFCATETGGRTGRRFWWAGLRDVASAASRKGTHVGAHTLLAEAIAAAPHLQLPHQGDWAHCETPGPGLLSSPRGSTCTCGLNCCQQLESPAGTGSSSTTQSSRGNPRAWRKRWARRQLLGAAWRLTRAPRPPWRNSTKISFACRQLQQLISQQTLPLPKATDQHQHCAPAAPITAPTQQPRHQANTEQQHQQPRRLPQRQLS